MVSNKIYYHVLSRRDYGKKGRSTPSRAWKQYMDLAWGMSIKNHRMKGGRIKELYRQHTNFPRNKMRCVW